MIDINPQLQSKIFDALLLHMKAERKGERFPGPPAPRGKPARGKVAAGKPGAGKAGAGKPAAEKSPAVAASPLWDSLAADLDRLGLHKTTADALVSWAASQAEQSRQSPVKIRVLHPMEREFISVEAYDYLLELYRLGLIGPPQLEQLIENCAFLTSLPATRVQIGKMALRAFSENLEMQGLGSSH
ncbi:MAG TPA: DUF494 family protein [Fibrobacteria bacterium]|nr:DUF494 family protein [Fibrobacteria bacterium]